MFSACNQNKPNIEETSLEKDSLHGNIKSIKHTYYGEYIENQRFKKANNLDRYYVIEKSYDKRGMLEKKSYYNEDDLLYNESTYVYERNGKLKKELYKYPNFGEVKQVVSYSEDFKKETSSYIDVNDDVSRKIFAKYNSRNRIESLYTTYGDNFFDFTNIESSSINKISEYEYDSNMSLSKKRVYGDEGELLYVYKYDYDNYGNNVIEIKMNTANDTVYKIKREFDENNNVIKEITQKNGIENITKYRYKYDALGNWTTKEVLLYGDVIRKEVREIKFVN